jgi:hypothetical protein
VRECERLAGKTRFLNRGAVSVIAAGTPKSILSAREWSLTKIFFHWIFRPRGWCVGWVVRGGFCGWIQESTVSKPWGYYFFMFWSWFSISWIALRTCSVLGSVIVVLLRWSDPGSPVSTQYSVGGFALWQPFPSNTFEKTQLVGNISSTTNSRPSGSHPEGRMKVFFWCSRRCIDDYILFGRRSHVNPWPCWTRTSVGRTLGCVSEYRDKFIDSSDQVGRFVCEIFDLRCKFLHFVRRTEELPKTYYSVPTP